MKMEARCAQCHTPAYMTAKGTVYCARCHVEVAAKDLRWGDPVDHPPHYGSADNPYEAIKVIEAWELGFCLGSTIKYLARAGKKGDALEDLEKARWYLDREIQRRRMS